jgi:hypothetical protein
LLNNYAAILEDLARFDEAAGYAERAYARAQKAGDEVVINQSCGPDSIALNTTSSEPRPLWTRSNLACAKPFHPVTMRLPQ